MPSKRKAPPSNHPSRRSHRLRPNELTPLLRLPWSILLICVNFAMNVKGEWGSGTFVADFGNLARVCRPLLQLTKGQPFLKSLYKRGLHFTKPFGRLDRILRAKMGRLIQDSVLNTASGAPLWGNLCRTDNICHWEGILTVPETSPFASADVAVNIHFGSEFPLAPFQVHFDSRVFHPNVNAHGKLCVPFLGAEWRPYICLSSLLWNIVTVLGMPHVPEEYDNDNEAMKLYIECPKLYQKRAEELYNEEKRGECTADASNTQQKQ